MKQKTQVSALVNGNGRIVGTPHDERSKVWECVISENPDIVMLRIDGMTLSLDKKTSVSGKTVWYAAEISADDYKALGGTYDASELKYQPQDLAYTVTLDYLGCVVSCRGRKIGANGRNRGKFDHFTQIDYSKITIL